MLTLGNILTVIAWAVAHLTPEMPYLGNLLSLVSGCLPYYSAIAEWRTGRSNVSHIDLEAGVNEPMGSTQTSWATRIDLVFAHFQLCIKVCVLLFEIAGLSLEASIGVQTDRIMSFILFIFYFKSFFQTHFKS